LRPRLLLPVNFPDVPDVRAPERALEVSLEELRHWDAAPQNPFWLDSVGIPFALTTHGLQERSAFWERLRKALRRGLSPERALAALTTQPAEFLGVSDIVGSIEPGKLANLLLCDGELFAPETELRSIFVAGEEFPLGDTVRVELRGVWSTAIPGLDTLRLRITGKRSAPELTLLARQAQVRASVQLQRNRLLFTASGDSLGISGVLRWSAELRDSLLVGQLLLPDGRTLSWQARRDSLFSPAPPEAPQREYALAPLVFPNGPYGLPSPPPQRAVLFRNATVWTCSPAGVLQNTDVLIRGGKIAAIGRGLKESADTVIDATGKHLTPGILDEHSHIAIEGGVNEGTHAVTAEVRIGDVIDPDDINIYRQLAGGVTAAHLLHGSANPIGGQCQLIKLRWGAEPEELKFEGAPATIKFALGENVKQSNWGDRFTRRYPQTRLGVEEIMRDAFQAALEYEAEWQRWRALPERERQRSIPPRRDLQLEALLEILRGKRLIHCHSYVQSEILMLMRLAEQFGFRVNVFTHVLEGYKVARELARHGAGASTFSDWWAYKFEVYDAIPYNPAIMHEQGVLVAINSDDAEMGRRLAQEAGKSVGYSGISEEEALKFVTLNPARMLRVDHRVGSIEVGKDADIVLWSGPPLSTRSVVEQTYVDGRCYFDRARDEQLRQRDAQLRQQLEQRALQALRQGEPPAAPKEQRRRLYHCEDNDDELRGYTP
jgi:imidazolonepropionase-like amidohydrolase